MNTLPGKGAGQKSMKGGPMPDQPGDDDRIRPGFVAALLASLAGVAALILMSLSGMHEPVSIAEAPALVKNFSPKTFPSGSVDLSSEPVATSAPMPSSEPVKTVQPKPSAPPGPIEGKWGIRIFGVWLAQDNAAVELSYQVTGPDRAKFLSGNNSENHLIDLASGKQIPLCPSQLKEWPFSPHSRARSMALSMSEAGTFPPPPNRLVAGKTYTVLIPNPNGLMESGSKVAVIVGGVRSGVILIE